MKRTAWVALVTLSLALSACGGETPPYNSPVPKDSEVQWTRQFGTVKNDAAFGVATHPNGNIAVVGYTEGNLAIENVGGHNAFIRVLDSAGRAIWTDQFGHTGTAVDFHTDASATVVGWGYTQLPGRELTEKYGFVRRYEPNGTVTWTQLVEDASEPWSVKAGPDGTVVVTGQTPGILGGQSFGYEDCFVRKYDSAGNALWTRQFGSANRDYCYGSALDEAGNILVAGGMWVDTPGTEYGLTRASLHKLSPDGEILWERFVGSGAEAMAWGVGTTSNDAIVVAGFSQREPSGLDPGGNFDFIQMLDSDGNDTWIREYVTGMGLGGVDVDAVGNTFHTNDVTWGNGSDAEGVYVRMLDPTGKEVWSTQFGGHLSHGNGIAVNHDGAVILAGSTMEVLGERHIGEYDAFVRKFLP